jgi:hypothetical protein
MTSGEPVVYRADHAGPPFDERIAACSRLLRRADLGRLDRISHHSVGVWDFTVRRGPDPDGDGPGGQRLGAHLSFQIDQIDEHLAGLNTGRLFRVVAQTEQGGVICCSPLANQYAIALSVGPPPEPPAELVLTEWADLRVADRAMTDLVNEIRTAISQPPQNFGGWLTEQSDQAAAVAVEAPGPSEAEREQVAVGGFEQSTAARLCRSAVRRADLHHVALFSANTCEFSADVFDHPGLAGYFTQISVAARRQAYRAVGEELAHWASQLARVVNSTAGGRLLRLVLDVEQGAIYYYRLAPNNYLVAVTLDQNQVSQADDQVARLALRIQQSAAADPEPHH